MSSSRSHASRLRAGSPRSRRDTRRYPVLCRTLREERTQPLLELVDLGFRDARLIARLLTDQLQLAAQFQSALGQDMQPAAELDELADVDRLLLRRPAHHAAQQHLGQRFRAVEQQRQPVEVALDAAALPSFSLTVTV